MELQKELQQQACFNSYRVSLKIDHHEHGINYKIKKINLPKVAKQKCDPENTFQPNLPISS